MKHFETKRISIPLIGRMAVDMRSKKTLALLVVLLVVLALMICLFIITLWVWRSPDFQDTEIPRDNATAFNYTSDFINYEERSNMTDLNIFDEPLHEDEDSEMIQLLDRIKWLKYIVLGISVGIIVMLMAIFIIICKMRVIEETSATAQQNSDVSPIDTVLQASEREFASEEKTPRAKERP